ncbi:single-stranded DNA-binding protein [Ornithinimicrobium murale]|uniref:single-stranded DNA-binding protein n=1 Tax=Ornithinimicrobium murale TaxID=1050153 RepID=UPI000E0DC81C|nr:single-stranded DNA-binding protein [Ornithinimicrobium murale]
MSTDSTTGLELKDSIYAFVASKPRLTYTENGDARLYFKAGQRHRHYDPEVGWQNQPTTFHDVVAFKGAAQFGIEHLREKDRFIAQGSLREYTNKHTGEREEQFEATRFLPATPPSKNTGGRAPRRTLERQTPSRDAASAEAPQVDQAQRRVPQSQSATPHIGL